MQVERQVPISEPADSDSIWVSVSIIAVTVAVVVRCFYTVIQIWGDKFKRGDTTHDNT
jgi:hypothetical protein